MSWEKKSLETKESWINWMKPHLSDAENNDGEKKEPSEHSEDANKQKLAFCLKHEIHDSDDLSSNES